MDINNSTYKDFYRQKEDAVLELVTKHRYPLIYFIIGYVKNYTVAEDIAGEAFVKLMIHKHKIKNCSLFKTYLFAIAKNLSLDYLRKNKREKEYISQNSLSEEENLNPEDVLCQNEKQREIIKCIEKLKDDYRSVLYLHYFEKLDISNISKIMKKNKKQIYNLLLRSKKALEPLLQEEGINYENE